MGNSLSSGTIEINNFEELLEFAEAGVKPGQKQLKLSPELGVLALSVKITFATLSVLHGVVKHAIFAGVYR